MICPNKFAKEVARASGRKMPNVSDELIKNGFDSVKSGDEIKQINTQKFSSNKVENSNLNALNNSNNEILRMATKAGEYEKVFQKEARGIHNVMNNGKKSTLIKRDLDSIDNAIKFERGFNNKNNKGYGAKHIIKHTINKDAKGYITDIELVNLGKNIREYIKNHKEPFIDKNGARIYEWENSDGVRFRAVVGDIQGKAPTTAVGSESGLALRERIITFYSDRNLNEPMKFKNPNLNQLEPIKEFGTNYAEFYHDGANAIRKLLAERQGQVAGAFEREELGDIDLVWGEVTDAIKHKGYGLAHILDKRTAEFIEQGFSKEQAQNKAIDFVKNIDEIIKNGNVLRDDKGRIRIESDKFIIGIKDNYYGVKSNNWIVTGYIKKENAESLYASSAITKGETLPLNSSVNSTTTANKSQEVNIEPIKEFGTNYAEFYHDGANAIKKLLIERQGQVAGAFYKDGKDIDLVWGEFKVVKGEIKGYGLSKIEAKHLNDFANFKGDTPQEKLVNGLNEIIENGKIVSDNGINTIIYKKGNNNFRVGLSKGFYNKGDNNWIITAYKVDKVPSSDFLPSSQIAKSDGTNLHSNTLPEVLESSETSYHDTFTAKEPLANQRVNSTTTANKSQAQLENILKGAEGREYPNTIAGRWEKRVDEAFDWAYKNIYAKGVRSGIKGASKITTFFGGDGDMVSRGLEKTFALQDEIGALSRAKSAYERNNQVARVEAMKVYENLVKLKIDERVALFRMLDGQEVEPNLSQKLRPIYEKLRDKIDERAEQLISLGALKGENAKENYIKYSYSQYYSDGSKGFGIGKLKSRNESLSYEDRVKMGLIEDAAVAVTQTLNSQNNQIQKAILFKNLADEYGVNQPKDGYVKVSDESVGGGIKKYGALAGKYVPSAVYDDLQNAGIVSSIFDVIRPYTNVIDHIKVNLTVKNPATHGYNVLSNSVLAFLHGDLGANLKLIKLLATDKKGFDELLAKADAMGLNSANDDIEMRNLLMANDKVAKEAAFSQNPLGYYIAASWQNIYLTQNSTTGRVARSAYAWEDKWFKLARFKKNLDAKMSDEAAFNDANSAYVDYSSHFNPALRLLDKTGVLPFFHFAVKSSIVVTKAAIKNPAKFAMLQTALIGSGASTLPYWFDNEQKDADNSRLPQWASSNYLPNLFGVKNQVQIGDSGLYFNAARAMAGFRLSSIDDITGGGGLVGGLLDILRGRDSWGNDMVGKHDPAIKQLTARLDAFSKQFLPSITLGRYGRQGVAIATGNNPKNAYDEPMGIGELAGRFIGIRMINEKKELRSAAISAKNRYKKAKEKGDEGAMAVALNDYMACKAAASDMGVSLEGLMKMKSKDIK